MAKTSREQIIRQALHLFKIKGYRNTSMADIGLACGLLKGSIYSHFSSKEALALEVMKFVHDYFSENIYSHAYDENRSISERVSSFVDEVERYFNTHEGGCLMGNLALEIGDTIPHFSICIQDYFDDWISALAYLLSKQYGQEKALELAQVTVANTQGAIMLMQLYRKPELLSQANQALVDLIS